MVLRYQGHATPSLPYRYIWNLYIQYQNMVIESEFKYKIKPIPKNVTLKTQDFRWLWKKFKILQFRYSFVSNLEFSRWHHSLEYVLFYIFSSWSWFLKVSSASRYCGTKGVHVYRGNVYSVHVYRGNIYSVHVYSGNIYYWDFYRFTLLFILLFRDSHSKRSSDFLKHYTVYIKPQTRYGSSVHALVLVLVYEWLYEHRWRMRLALPFTTELPS